MDKKYTFIELQRLFRRWIYQQEFINDEGFINADFLAWLEIEDRIHLPIKKRGEADPDIEDK